MAQFASCGQHKQNDINRQWECVWAVRREVQIHIGVESLHERANPKHWAQNNKSKLVKKRRINKIHIHTTQIVFFLFFRFLYFFFVFYMFCVVCHVCPVGPAFVPIVGNNWRPLPSRIKHSCQATTTMCKHKHTHKHRELTRLRTRHTTARNQFEHPHSLSPN